MNTGMIQLRESDHPYAYGHLTPEEAQQALLDDDRESYPCVTEHIWLRWVPSGKKSCHIHDAKPNTRGAFRATRIVSVAEIEAENALKADIMHKTAELETWVKERFPGASVVDRSAWPTITPFIRFTLEGLDRSVETRKIGVCYVAHVDQQTFNERYAGNSKEQEDEK